ncbi:hypothetical protein XELAEV_18007538mg [Xenopus laevis]|uniref:Uncharacterized protein n=1 Tax=Xenopus laevis TaxID=8355 RepID=A0A974I5H1_XENLA|nr:hypothetical protein XELAEV_18007538mg [Xenopus laevis]
MLNIDTRLKAIFMELLFLSYRQPLNLRKIIIRSRQKLSTRMENQLHKIKTKACDKPMGQYLCNQNYSLQDIKVLILKGNVKTKRERKIYEFKCMELFNT